MSVRANVGLRAAGARVDEYLERFRISHLAKARPAELSGGERQRVALARALARDPRRAAPRRAAVGARPAHEGDRARRAAGAAARARRCRRCSSRTTTRTRPSLADRVGVIVDGRLDQLGTPKELVAQPGRRVRRVLHRRERPPRRARARARRADRDRARERPSRSTRPTPADGAVDVVVYPWEISVGARARRRDSALNRVRGRDRLARRGREPHARPDRPARRRDHDGVGRAARAPPRRRRHRDVQGDGDAGRVAPRQGSEKPHAGCGRCRTACPPAFVTLSAMVELAERYDVILRDGSTLRLRAPGAADRDALVAFFEALSPESLYLRFHGIPPRRRAALVEPLPRPRLGGARRADRLAGRAGDERIVALASYARLRDPQPAEVAFAVADELPAAAASARACSSSSPRARRTLGIDALRRRGAGREPAMLARLRATPASRRRASSRAASVEVRLPDRADRAASARASTSATTSPSPRRCGRSSSRAASPSIGASPRARLDRRRALPQHPRGRLRGRRVPGQPQRRRRSRACTRYALDRRDRRRAVDLAVICVPGEQRARRGARRRCGAASARSASSPPASPRPAPRASSARSGCSRSCARTARG